MAAQNDTEGQIKSKKSGSCLRNFCHKCITGHTLRIQSLNGNSPGKNRQHSRSYIDSQQEKEKRLWGFLHQAMWNISLFQAVSGTTLHATRIFFLLYQCSSKLIAATSGGPTFNKWSINAFILSILIQLIATITGGPMCYKGGLQIDPHPLPSTVETRV